MHKMPRDMQYTAVVKVKWCGSCLIAQTPTASTNWLTIGPGVSAQGCAVYCVVQGLGLANQGQRGSAVTSCTTRMLPISMFSLAT